MTNYWLPPKVSRELREKSRSLREDMLRSAIVEEKQQRAIPILREFNDKLRRIDPRLQMILAHERVTPGLPMRGGYYHVIRDNPGAPPTIMIVEGENGEFVEPTSRVFERLAAGDLHEPRTMRHWKRIEREAADAARRERAREREERQEHLRDFVNANWRTSVSMNGSRPWTQNMQGAARRDAGQRRNGT
jgi:hypothetical protein